MASVRGAAIVAVSSNNWETTRVVLAAGSMPLARTRRKYSNCPKKTITPMPRVKYQPPTIIIPSAKAIAKIALTMRGQGMVNPEKLGGIVIII